MKMNIAESTICSWYSDENKKRFEELGEDNYTPNDTQINPKQRPRCLIDMENVLAHVVNKSRYRYSYEQGSLQRICSESP